MPAAYYNELDPFAAAWLRELIAAGHIAYGIVDERSIEDVQPQDLNGFTQCHFFAGIGVWSYALRQAGWPDDRPVWTGSCPCQPFSSSGRQQGFNDERHLWPAWAELIGECRPAIVFGEQVAGKAAGPWFDLVQADLEGMDYAFGCVPFPSAGVGAPHIRDRAYWVADSSIQGLQERSGERRIQSEALEPCEGEAIKRSSNAGGVGDTNGEPCERDAGKLPKKEAESPGAGGKDGRHNHRYTDASKAGGVADTNVSEPQQLAGQGARPGETESRGAFSEFDGCGSLPGPRPSGPTNGFWRDVDWLGCRDGKWRPVEPGTFPLVNGSSARVGRLRGYGNAINAEAATAFIECFTQFKDQ